MRNRATIPTLAAALALSWPAAAAQQQRPAPEGVPAGDPASALDQPVQTPESTVAYLGVMVEPTGAETAAQLGLPQGVGLTVQQVADDSPAAGAGLKRFDVLHQFNDQLLVNQQQFVTLLRSHQPGDVIDLALFRGGKKVAQPVTLGVLPAPAGEALVLLPAPNAVRQQRAELNQQMQALRAKIERMDAELAQRDDLNANERQRLQQMLNRLRQEAQQQPAVGFGPGALPGDAEGNFPGAVHFVRMTDPQHVIEIRRAGDEKRLIVTDRASGEQLFDGPINTDEQRAAVPEGILQKVEKIENRVRVEINVLPRIQLRKPTPPTDGDDGAEPGNPEPSTTEPSTVEPHQLN